MAVSSEAWMNRAAMLELLSMGLLVPTADLAEALVSGEYVEACGELLLACGMPAGRLLEGVAAYEGRDLGETLSEVRRDHTRFFSNAPEPLVTPYVGVWAARRRGQKGLLFVGRESMAIERFMRRCGVAKDLAAGQSNDPVDHIGTVCEFMKYLCLVNARAIAPAAGSEVREDDFEVFHLEHFRDYAIWCASEIRKNDPSPFYAFVADALEQAALRFV